MVSIPLCVKLNIVRISVLTKKGGTPLGILDLSYFYCSLRILIIVNTEFLYVIDIDYFD